MSHSPQLQPGTIFAGQFRILARLSVGGMGALYVAEQLGTGHQRALKLMSPEAVQDARGIERFTQEAQAGGRIESEHVVQVVCAGIDAETRAPWLAMELLRGDDLSVVMQRRGPMQPAEVLEVFKQLCHALAAAHRAGVIHRDVKPENVFMAESRRSDTQFTVKVLDFGIAKWLSENSAAAVATAIIGSPMWMAPEQLDSHGMIRPATDIWPLGLLAFYLLTGRSYWIAANTPGVSITSVISEIAIQPIVPATQRAAQLGASGVLPPGFDDWFARCVTRDAQQRYQNASDALAGLAPVLSRASLPATVLGSQGVFTSPTPAPGAWGSQSTPPPGHASQPGTPAPTAFMPQFSAPGGYVSHQGYPTGAPPGFPVQYTSAPAAAPAPSRGKGAVIALATLAILGGGAFAGYTMWERVESDSGSAASPQTAASTVPMAPSAPATPSAPVMPAPPPPPAPTAPSTPVATTPPGPAPEATAPTPEAPAPAPAPEAPAPAPAPAPPPRPTSTACNGTWSGSMQDSNSEGGVGVVNITGSGPRCGSLIERWQGGTTCVYSLSGCSVDGAALRATGRTSSHNCTPTVPIMLRCTGARAILREGGDNSAAAMLTRR